MKTVRIAELTFEEHALLDYYCDKKMGENKKRSKGI